MYLFLHSHISHILQYGRDFEKGVTDIKKWIIINIDGLLFINIK